MSIFQVFYLFFIFLSIDVSFALDELQKLEEVLKYFETNTQMHVEQKLINDENSFDINLILSYAILFIFILFILMLVYFFITYSSSSEL